MSEQHHYHAHIPHDEEVESEADRFIEKSLDRIVDVTKHLDHQINIVIGISVAVFAFAASVFEKGHGSLAFLILMFFAASAALTGLIAIHPPYSFRKHGQKESILYRKTIEEFGSPEEYMKAMEEILNSPEKIHENYAVEIFNLCKYYYRPKRVLFHLSRKLLFAGIVFSLLAFVVSLITASH